VFLFLHHLFPGSAFFLCSEPLSPPSSRGTGGENVHCLYTATSHCCSFLLILIPCSRVRPSHVLYSASGISISSSVKYSTGFQCRYLLWHGSVPQAAGASLPWGLEHLLPTSSSVLGVNNGVVFQVFFPPHASAYLDFVPFLRYLFQEVPPASLIGSAVPGGVGLLLNKLEMAVSGTRQLQPLLTEANPASSGYIPVHM